MSRLLLPRSSLLHTTHPTRLLTTTAHPLANPLPLTTPGPPPAPPTPSPHDSAAHLQRRRQQAALLKQGQDLRSAPTPNKPGAALKKRFWKDVHIRHDNNHHTITLDSRAVRAPATKSPLLIPASKPQLAAAIALEWDLLLNAAQALKSHLIPLTSLASRASDIASQDAGIGLVSGKLPAREEIIKSMLRYLDTDTLLCWAPAKTESESETEAKSKGLTLRETQIRAATPIITYLTMYIWPGVRIHPALEETGSLMPRPQEQITKDVVRGWMAGLGAWELAGLERGVLASKSLLVGARLVVEWSERFHDLQKENEVFTIERAAEACSLEVAWQTGIWGEVEDTHDVEKEDLRRQLGSVVLLVSGTGEDG